MPEERLEFSAQDLGRLAKYLEESYRISIWLDLHAVNSTEAQRVRNAFYEGVYE